MSSHDDHERFLFEQFVKLRPGTNMTAHVDEMYKHIKTQPDGQQLIDCICTFTKKKMDERPMSIHLAGEGLSSWAHKSEATADGLNAVFYSRIWVQASYAPFKEAASDFGGICGSIPGFFVIGTFYWNDDNDVRPSDENVASWLTIITAYFQIVYFRNNRPIAQFSAAGVAAGTCSMGGTTKFKS